MAKRKAGKIFAVIFVLCLLVFAIGGIAWLTNGFQSGIKTFGVKIGSDVIVRDTDYLYMRNGETIDLLTVFSNSYDVEIITKEAAKDFDISVIDEKYTWNNDVAGKDFTQYFEIEKRQSSFTLNYGNLSEILTKSVGIEVHAYNTSELFDMRITSGNSTITLGFSVCLPAAELELDNSSIIF